MSSRPSRRGVQRLGVGLIAVSLALTAVGTVMAHTGSPSAITVTPTSGQSIQASGTWSWPAMATAGHLSYIGFAIDWGDVTSGNALGTFHIGDGTPATNVIMQPTSPAQGASGSWGPVSHTYAAPGIYTVCVIIYDLGLTKPFTTTGYHSLQAGGTNHNTDNSVDHGSQVPTMCGRVDLTAPSPSPTAVSSPTALPTPTSFESFQGATSDPTASPPPTNAASSPSAPDPGTPALPLALLIASSLAAVFVFRTTKVARR
jgi:hypothetical protein